MDQIQKVLMESIRANPKSVITYQSLKNFLYDLDTIKKLHQNLLLRAYDMKVIEKLKTNNDATLNAINLIQDMYYEFGINLNYSFWAVETWCYILKKDDIAKSISGLRPFLIEKSVGDVLPPVEEFILYTGVHKAGTDFPTGEICVEPIGVPEYNIYYGTSSTPQRISARSIMGRRVYLNLEKGQYLKIECTDLSMQFKVKLIN